MRFHVGSLHHRQRSLDESPQASYVMRSRLRKFCSETAAFLAFAVVYYAPHVAALTTLVDAPVGIRALISEALTLATVQRELVSHLVFGHLLPLVVCYALLCWLARRFAAVSGIGVRYSMLSFLVVGWLVMVSSNRIAFPLSDYSMAFEAIATRVSLIVATLVLTTATVVALAAWTRPARVMSIAGGLAMVVVALGAASWRHGPSASVAGSRNVIVIGVDSLSAHAMGAQREHLPNLARLLSHATTFDRAYTPLGRTYPAWVSILSGRPPAEHGAIFNLRGLEHANRSDLVSRKLRAVGYRTVLAIDERRFSNIDESFGFDRVVGPKAGALDFMLQGFNDTPLTNLLLQTRVGGALLPHSWLNTASFANYDERGFVREAVAALSGADKVFLAVHFESAHYPYKSRHAEPRAGDPNHFRAGYVAALAVVDRQVGQLVAALRTDGYLQHALLIVLSDHGESLGEDEGEISGASGKSRISGYGHGADILSEEQNRVVLGLVPFENGQPAARSSARSEQVSLTDVRATIERYVDTGVVNLESVNPCMTVETGIRFAAAANFLTLDERKLAREGAGYYEVDEKGRLRLRESILPALVRAKDVGLRCKDRITYYSSALGRYLAYGIDASGRELTEIRPAVPDIERIDAYRARLGHSVGG